MVQKTKEHVAQRYKAALDVGANLLGPISWNSLDAAVVIDANQSIVAANPAAEAIFGWTQQSLIGRSLNVLLPDTVQGRHEDHVRQFVCKETKPRTMGAQGEIEGQRSNGEIFPAEASILYVEGTDGAAYFAAILRDITERRQQEEENRRSARRYEALFNLSYQFVGLLAPDGTLLDANKSSLDFIASTAEAVRGIPLYDGPWFTDCPESRERLKRAINEVVLHRQSVRDQADLRDHAGQLHVFDFSLKPMLGEDGQVESLIAEARDITDITNAHRDLQRSEYHLRNAQRIARIGNWYRDFTTGRVYLSDEAYRILGRTRSDTPPTFSDFLSMVHPDDRGQVKQAAMLNPDGEACHALDFRIMRPDGKVRIVHQQGEVLFHNRRAVRMEGVLQDVTEEREAQAQLIQQRRRAEESSEAKSRFLSTVSHELRTPLNAIIGFSEILSEQMFGPLINEQYVQYAEDIMASGRHLYGVIQSILDVTRIERDALTLSEDWIAICDLLAGVTRLFRASQEQGCLSISLDMIGGGPEIYGDERLLRQGIFNLLENCRKFDTSGEPVSVRMAMHDNGLVVSVRDHGPGIDDSQLDRAMEPFVQLDDGLQRRHEGLGLGLYLVKTFMEMHDGQLTLSNAEGGGAVARLYFPSERLRYGEIADEALLI